MIHFPSKELWRACVHFLLEIELFLREGEVIVSAGLPGSF